MTESAALKSALRSIKTAAEKARVKGKKCAEDDEGVALLRALGLANEEAEGEGADEEE